MELIQLYSSLSEPLNKEVRDETTKPILSLLLRLRHQHLQIQIPQEKAKHSFRQELVVGWMQGKAMEMEMYNGIIPYLCGMFNQSRRRWGFQRLRMGDLPEPGPIHRKFRIAGMVVILLRKWRKESEAGHMAEV